MVDNLDNGQLNVKLDLILTQLDSVVKTMITKDLFDTWRQGNNDRLTRLEDDHKAWVRQSTEAHVSLDKDSKARHAEAEKQIEEVEVRLTNRMEKEKARADHIEAEQRARKNSTAKFVVGLVVTSLLSIAAIVASIITAVIK